MSKAAPSRRPQTTLRRVVKPRRNTSSNATRQAVATASASESLLMEPMMKVFIGTPAKNPGTAQRSIGTEGNASRAASADRTSAMEPSAIE